MTEEPDRTSLLAYCGLYCGDCMTCETLRAAHVGIHEEACTLNLKAIREIGLDAWLESGERHCYWTLDVDGDPGNG